MEDRKDLMDILSSPALSLTSDPALLNDWEWQLCEKDFKLSFDSDEVEALHLVQEETTAWKNRTRVVIQHRAWQTKDIFRSEADYIDGIKRISCQGI
jgi:chromosome transmission fidelity protein 18